MSYFFIFKEQREAGNEFLKLETGEPMCEGERWWTQPQRSLFLSVLSLQLKNHSKKWKGTASAWGAREWKDQFFIEFIFYTEFEEKIGT